MESSTKKTQETAFANERANMLNLLAKNPNHFGNAPDTKFKAVQAISSNTFYEEIGCVGYNPDLNELFATIQIKRDSGYSGNLCTGGSREYVRFFINYGAGWEDQGVTAINVHDIPTEKDCKKDSEKPLSYTASVKLKAPEKRLCNTEVLPMVRAILAWQVVPPNNGNWVPVWGDREDCQIQLKPFKFHFPPFEIDDFLPKFIEIATAAPELTVGQVTQLANMETATPKSLADFEPKELEVLQLANLYKEKQAFSVAPLRFALPTLEKALLSPQALELTAASFLNIPNLNLGDLLAELEKTSANTNFEQLECLGLDYNRERLTATFRIKRQSGYSGDLCQKGSNEYVAFWADWDDDCKFSYLGTVAVNVHDLKENTKDGICYTAVLPKNLDRLKQHCSSPKIVRLRAVMSWNSLPSTTDPDALNTYGNRIDTHIQIRPGGTIGAVQPAITVLGGIPVDQINDVTGLTKPGAFFALTGIVADTLGRACPFAGRVVLQGPLFPDYKYRVQVRKIGESSWTDVVTPLTLVGYNPFPPFNVIYTFSAPDPVTHYYDYQPDYKNIDNILAWWDTGGNDRWEVKLDIQGIAGSFSKILQLNHQGPTVEIHIDGLGGSGTGDCKDFRPGDVMNGRFVAESNYMGSFNLGTNVPGGVMVPGSGNSNTAPSPGDNWTMTLPAATIQCGYYVAVHAVDRTIINSSGVGFHNNDDAGFCVRK